MQKLKSREKLLLLFSKTQKTEKKKAILAALSVVVSPWPALDLNL
jgi:hypothetical protein